MAASPWFERAKLSRHTEGTEFPRSSRDRRSRALTKARSAFRTTWAWPGFLLSFHSGGSGSEQYCDPRSPNLCRGLSRRFNSRCSRALSPSGEREFNPFAVVVPECGARRRYRRATGTSLLVAPPDLGVCEDGSISYTVTSRATSCGVPCFAARCLSNPPARLDRARGRRLRATAC